MVWAGLIFDISLQLYFKIRHEVFLNHRRVTSKEWNVTSLSSNSTWHWWVLHWSVLYLVTKLCSLISFKQIAKNRVCTLKSYNQTKEDLHTLYVKKCVLKTDQKHFFSVWILLFGYYCSVHLRSTYFFMNT